MDNETLSQFVIATEDELKLLFPNQMERIVFTDIINRLIYIIQERTTLHGIKLYVE